MAPRDALVLQRLAGNRAVSSLMQRPDPSGEDRSSGQATAEGRGPSRHIPGESRIQTNREQTLRSPRPPGAGVRARGRRGPAGERLLQLRATVASLGHAIVSDRARLDPTYDELARQLFRHARTTWDRVAAWEQNVTAYQLRLLRADLMQDVSDELTEAVAGKLPLGGQIVALGLATYRASQTMREIEHEVDLAVVRQELAGRLGGTAFELLSDLLITEGSLIHALRRHAGQGAAIERASRDRVAGLRFDLEELDAGNPISHRRQAMHEQAVSDLSAEYARWKDAYEQTRRQARAVVAGVPAQLNDAFGRMLEAYSSRGGTVPMGPERAELARYRLQMRLQGRSGRVVGRQVLVDQQRYDLWGPARTVARPHQHVEVVRVHLPGGTDAHRTRRIETYYPWNFALEVELGPFTATVPSVMGLTRDQARSRVFHAGLLPEIREVRRSDIAGGIALGTDPPAATRLVSDPRKTFPRVTVFVSVRATEMT